MNSTNFTNTTNTQIVCCDSGQVVSIFMVLFFLSIIGIILICFCKNKRNVSIYEAI